MLLVDNNADDDEFLIFDRDNSNTNSLFDNLDLITPKETNDNNIDYRKKSALKKKSTQGPPDSKADSTDQDDMRKFKSEINCISTASYQF